KTPDSARILLFFSGFLLSGMLHPGPAYNSSPATMQTKWALYWSRHLRSKYLRQQQAFQSIKWMAQYTSAWFSPLVMARDWRPVSGEILNVRRKANHPNHAVWDWYR